MKRILICIIVCLMTAFVTNAQVHVKGYYKKNGTYVEPHVRSSPDSNPYNNYSYPGNTNPYTGKTATGDPDTYINNYYNRSKSTSSSSYKPNKDIITVNDKSGNLAYRLFYLDTSVGDVDRYKVYDNQYNLVGTVKIFADGDYWFYDLNGKLVKP